MAVPAVETKGYVLNERLLVEDTLFEPEIPLDLVFLDRYARQAHQRDVQKIADAWDEQKARLIIVSYRDADGRFACLDGWHRVCAARIIGKTTIRGQVFIDLSYQREAELFEAFNTIRAHTPVTRFKAGLEAGHYREVEIHSIITSAGLILPFNGERKRNVVGGLAVVMRVFNGYGSARLRTIFRILTSAWGTEPVVDDAFCGIVLGGLHHFLARYYDHPLYDEALLISKLSEFGPQWFKSQARARAGGPKMTQDIAFGQILREQYNYRRKTTLPEWREKVPSPAAMPAYRESIKRATEARVRKRAARKP